MRAWLRLGLAGAAMLVAGCSSTPAAPTLYLGYVANYTGADRVAAQNARRGIELALRHFNKNPDKSMTVKVRVVEVADKLDAFESAAARLVSVNRVAALLGGRTVAEAERLDRGGVPVLSPIGSRSRAMTEYAFCTGLTPAFRGRVLAKFAAEELKAKRVAIFADDRSEEAGALAEAFAREWPAVAGEPKQPRPRPEFFGKQAKLADLLSNLEKEKVQAVVIAGKVDGDWPAVSVPILYGGDEADWPRKPAGVVYTTTAFVRDADSKEVKEFVKEYRGIHEEDPDVNAAVAYDDTRMLLDALVKSEPNFGAAALRKALAETDKFAGLSGPMGFDKEQCLRRPAFVVRWDNGQVKMVKKYSPP
jgi:branched-chain amino acid transport system substrate-binding protein